MTKKELRFKVLHNDMLLLACHSIKDVVNFLISKSPLGMKRLTIVDLGREAEFDECRGVEESKVEWRIY